MTKVRIVSISFVSDHGLLLMWLDHWGSKGMTLGDRYPKPEWTFEDMVGNNPGWPVTHSMNSTIKLEITLDCDLPAGSKPVQGALFGFPSHGITFRKEKITLRSGRETVIQIESDGTFPENVQTLSLLIVWHFISPDCYPLIGTSRIPVFLTMGSPKTVPDFPGITTARMSHSINQVSGAKSNDPHKIIEHILIKWVNRNKLYDPDIFHQNAWNIGSRVSGDCDSISRYIKNILLMVGCPGHIEAVRVWTKLKNSAGGTSIITPSGRKKIKLSRVPKIEDFEIVETPIDSGGLEDPALGHPSEPWELALIDGSHIPNDYEACIKLTQDKKGTPTYFTPGTEIKVAHESIGSVIKHCFESLSWVEETNTDKIVKTLGDVKQLADPGRK